MYFSENMNHGQLFLSFIVLIAELFGNLPWFSIKKCVFK
jgi:hypothetical protein